MRTLTLSLSLALVAVACGDSGGTPTTTNAESTGESTEGQTTTGSASDPQTTGSTAEAPTTSGEEPTTAEPLTTGEPMTTGMTSTGGPGVCGDGVVDEGEACDDGNDINTDACVEGCKDASCGDGFTGPGEACDDGNGVDDDECSNECAAASCGDGEVQRGEACDDGNEVDSDECLNTCVAASCGDNVVHEGVEECDDGNEVNTDACTNMCQSASCTDKLKNGTESDVDCGGDACDACANGEACVDSDDCSSGSCKNKICSAVTLTIGPCAAASVTSMQAYTGVIQPKCGCHAGGSGGLTMSNAATFKSNTVNVDSTMATMKLITPNNIDASYLLYKVHGQQANAPGGGGSTMPLGGQALSDAEKCTLINWVKSGAN